MRAIRILSTAVLVAALLAVASPEAKAAKRSKRGGDGLPLRFRFGLTLDGARNIEFGSKKTTVADDAGLGGNLGISYVGIQNLSLDADLELVMDLTPKLETSRLQLTPGARYDIIKGIYLRAGAPLIFYPSPFNAGVLAGVGYRQKASGLLGGYFELAYERYLLKEESRVVLRGGLEAGN